MGSLQQQSTSGSILAGLSDSVKPFLDGHTSVEANNGNASTRAEDHVYTEDQLPVLRLLYYLESLFDHGLKNLAIFSRTSAWEYVSQLPACLPDMHPLVRHITQLRRFVGQQFFFSFSLFLAPPILLV
jgi:hypothetical protein